MVVFTLVAVEMVITVVRLVLVLHVLGIVIGRQLVVPWESVTAAAVIAILVLAAAQALPRLGEGGTARGARAPGRGRLPRAAAAAGERMATR
jgi:hypothetical protein